MFTRFNHVQMSPCWIKVWTPHWLKVMAAQLWNYGSDLQMTFMTFMTFMTSWPSERLGFCGTDHCEVLHPKKVFCHPLNRYDGMSRCKNAQSNPSSSFYTLSSGKHIRCKPKKPTRITGVFGFTSLLVAQAPSPGYPDLDIGAVKCLLQRVLTREDSHRPSCAAHPMKAIATKPNP